MGSFQKRKPMPRNSTAVAMGLFLEALDTEVNRIRERFDTRHVLHLRAFAT